MAASRQALSQAHPAKTNVLSIGLTCILVLIVSLQIWLLSASLNTSLGGDRHIAWPAFYASLGLFLAGSVALNYLPRPIRRAVTVERAEPFTNAALAWRTLVISTVSLAVSFAVWFMWSAITVKLNDCGFSLTKNQLFWLTATPVILGSLLRIPYGVLVSRFGSRRSYSAVTLLLLVPALGTGFAVQNPNTPYGILLFWAAITGIAGANFATSMAVVTLWFPKKLQGSALGINGLGNLGVTIAQFTIPVVLGIAFLGGLTGSPLAMKIAGGATKPAYLQHAAFVWVPLILLCAAAIWFGTRDFPMEPKTVRSQLAVAGNKHTWITSFLYFLTFGCFVAMGASLPLIIKDIFAKAPGGAPNPLIYAPFAPLIATLLRPVGGVAADKFGAGRMTAIAVGVMALGGFSLTQFLDPHQFRGFFGTIMVICAASGFGNGSVFKIIPTVNPKEAGPTIGFVSCVGALGGFFPPLLLAATIEHFGSPALAYTAMAMFGLACFAVNWWYYWREGSPTHC
jgi:NNP family nitrate/nitrite transporter-like MFS transporter